MSVDIHDKSQMMNITDRVNGGDELGANEDKLIKHIRLDYIRCLGTLGCKDGPIGNR
jgi:hypothetical protein